MKITKENLIAGIIAIIAFVAIICELVFGGISTESVAGAVKDITGIVVDIGVFLLAFRFALKKPEEESLDVKISTALNKWRSENSSMIIRDEEYDLDKNYFSFFMRTDVKNFFADATAEKTIGWFVRVPKVDSDEYLNDTFKIQFHLNISTFLKGKQIEDRKKAFEAIAGDIAKYIQAKCEVAVDKISVSDNDATIDVIVNGLTTDGNSGDTIDDQIQKFISIIDAAYKCYLVAGNFKV